MGSHFDTLKHKFQKGTIRGYPDFDNPEPLIIDTESSGFHITAALSQKQGDQEVFLGYVARTCHKSHQTYPEHSRGLCAAVLGLRGQLILDLDKVNIWSDNSSNKFPA